MSAKVIHALLGIILIGMLLSGCNGRADEGSRETPKATKSPAGATPQERAPQGSDAGEGEVELKVTLSAQNIVPAPGDGDLSGSGTIRVAPDEGEVCPNLNIPMPDTDINAAHVHRGAAGVNGPVVASLDVDPGDVQDDCVTADKSVLNEIEDEPGNFYVDVHTRDFPNGAIRGQLSR